MFDKIDRNLLTRDQRTLLERYEQGFGSPFWALIVERFQAHLDSNQAAYDSAVGEQQLGLIQGLRRANAEVVRLDEIIEREIESALGADEAPEPEGPEFDDAWIAD